MTRALFYHPRIENIPLLTAPLAYLHLATALGDTDHTLELLDGRVEANPVERLRREAGRFDVLLVSTMPGSQITSAVQGARAVRQQFPDMPIFWGGPHPSVDPHRTAASSCVSGVIAGRGEFTIGELMNARADEDALGRIPNFHFRNPAGCIVRGPFSNFNTRKPNPPNFGLLPNPEPYFFQTRRSTKMIDYISSFGCPHRCTFCSEPVTSGSQWSAMDADVLVGEIRGLIERYAIDGVLFQDAKFVTDRDRLSKFCTSLIETGTRINWIATACSTDIAGLHRNALLGLMRDSGCEQLFLGAEAASTETLSKYRKSIDGDGNYRIAKLLWQEYGILPHFSYVISYPIEDLDQVRKTLFLHQSVCELVQAPTGELGLYNPVPQTAFLHTYQNHFREPETLEGWSEFNYFSQKLYREPSRELDKLLFQHHVKIRRMFPDVESHKTFDVWQTKQ